MKLDIIPSVHETDLSDEQWELVRLLVEAKTGRKVKVSRREIVNATLYLARTGCKWRLLPYNFPNWSTVYSCYHRWAWNGTLDKMHPQLGVQVRDLIREVVFVSFVSTHLKKSMIICWMFCCFYLTKWSCAEQSSSAVAAKVKESETKKPKSSESRIILVPSELIITLQPPKKISIDDILDNYKVTVRNASHYTIAFSMHPLIMKILFYDKRGRLLSIPESYAGEFSFAETVLWNMTMLRPGETIVTSASTMITPRSVAALKLKKQRNIKMRVVIMAVPKKLWPSSFQKMLKDDDIKILSYNSCSPLYNSIVD